MDSFSVSGLIIYPIKSCRGIRLSEAYLTETGLQYDRQFLLCQLIQTENDLPKYKMLTMRTHPKMGLIHTEIVGSNILASIQGTVKKTSIPLEPPKNMLQNCQVMECMLHFTCVSGYDLGEEVSEMFSAFLDMNVRVIYRGPIPRKVKGQLPLETLQNGKHPITAFPDGFPYLLCTEASLSTVNERMESNGEQALDIIRFRPNIIIRGCDAFEEDRWKTVLIGSAGKFYIISHCLRCLLPNVDLSTGTRSQGNFPYKVLSEFRKVDPSTPNKPCFGMNAVADKIDGSIHVGDKVYVLATGAN